ncbi:MAG: hypothetical protein ACOYL6_16355 [Bacteriovoracaceae bacterium]
MRTINAQIISLGLKLLVGVILSFIIVYSFLQAAEGFQHWLLPKENQEAIVISVFGFVFILSTFFLFFTFRQIRTSSGITDYQELATKFCEGLITGLAKNDESIQDNDLQ